jgi:hypothetical protein
VVIASDLSVGSPATRAAATTAVDLVQAGPATRAQQS